jgi:hypothetical protein
MRSVGAVRVVLGGGKVKVLGLVLCAGAKQTNKDKVRSIQT